MKPTIVRHITRADEGTVRGLGELGVATELSATTFSIFAREFPSFMRKGRR